MTNGEMWMRRWTPRFVKPEAARLRHLAEARADRARKKMMATPEWQAAHAARCAQWQVDSKRQRIARLHADIADMSALLRRLFDALRASQLRGGRSMPMLLKRIPDGWRRRRYLQRELRMAELA